MQPVVLFRKHLMEDNELDAAEKAGFKCLFQRAQIPSDSIVIARYSALPYYLELEKDLNYNKSILINTHQEHEWIANMDWAFDEYVQKLTFPTWTSLDQAPKNEAPFVLKGRTNSKKQRWSTHMYAETWQDALDVQRRLEDDGLIGEQGIVIRKYIPLETYFNGIGGVPITKEFRVFIYKQQVLSVAYYWNAFIDDFAFYNKTPPVFEDSYYNFVNKVMYAVGDFATFYVADVAQDQNGKWWLVEINDGQMSGLSGNSPIVLYSRLFGLINENKIM